MSGTSFHLIVDSLTTASAPATTAPLVVPESVSYLAAPPDDDPYLTVDEPVCPACVLETVRVGSQPRLLLLSPPELRARVNGQPVPRVALLNVRDQLQVSGGPILHVTVHQDLQIGPPPAEALGKECPICRTQMTSETTAYVCPSCRTALHSEGESRLDCVNVGSECPVCGTAISLKAGYVYIPEL